MKRPKGYVKGKHERVDWGHGTKEIRGVKKIPKNIPSKTQKTDGKNLEISDRTSLGVYSNAAIVSHTETEFLLDFLFLAPNTPKTKIRERIVLHPRTAKRLVKALKSGGKPGQLEHYPRRPH